MANKNNAQDCIYKLCDELLGKDYYIVDPVGANQANEIITERIIELYKKKTLKEKFKEFLGR
jgi:hypothetical protein